MLLIRIVLEYRHRNIEGDSLTAIEIQSLTERDPHASSLPDIVEKEIIVQGGEPHHGEHVTYTKKHQHCCRDCRGCSEGPHEG